MKRIIILALASLAAASVQAQTISEAIALTDNLYTGTARSAALGNAVTALGGDLGMIEINPAGSAVAGYSQFAITPNLNFGHVNSTYASVGNYTPQYASGVIGESSDTRFMFTMPNVGFSLNISGGSSSLKGVTFSFVANSTGVFNERFGVGGLNDCFTSMTGSLSSQCGGYTPQELDGSYWSNVYWPYQLAYKSGMIRSLGGYDEYAGAAEVWGGDYYCVGAPLQQWFTRERRGTKTDMVFNFACNFSDRFYVGLNVGIPTSNLTTTTTVREEAQNVPGTSCDIVYDLNGEAVRFVRTGYTQWERITTTGVFAKLGFIFVPVPGLRLAGAIQTPTAIRVSRCFQYDGYSDFSYVNRAGTLNAASTTPEGEERYRLTAPFRYNLGAALTFGQYMLVSVDWEAANFNQMRFLGSNGADDYADVNRTVSQVAGMSSSIRAGIEVKPLPQLAVRVGYNSKKNVFEGVNDFTRAISAGLGYYSNGSFYCDLTGRLTRYPTEYYYPYADYIDGCGVPEMELSRRMIDVVFTFGWRF